MVKDFPRKDVDFSWAEVPTRTWDPIASVKCGRIFFKDEKTYALGTDPSGLRFKEISRRMFSGHYYPPDAVRFDGKFMQEHRDLIVGDRVIQTAPLLGKLPGPSLTSVVEIYICEQSDDKSTIGYVTTSKHFASGMWTAELTKTNGMLMLKVSGRVCPGPLFLIGLPYARFLQLRAWRRAVEVFQKL